MSTKNAADDASRLLPPEPDRAAIRMTVCGRGTWPLAQRDAPARTQPAVTARMSARRCFVNCGGDRPRPGGSETRLATRSDRQDGPERAAAAATSRHPRGTSATDVSTSLPPESVRYLRAAWRRIRDARAHRCQPARQHKTPATPAAGTPQRSPEREDIRLPGRGGGRPGRPPRTRTGYPLLKSLPLAIFPTFCSPCTYRGKDNSSSMLHRQSNIPPLPLDSRIFPRFTVSKLSPETGD